MAAVAAVVAAVLVAPAGSASAAAPPAATGIAYRAGDGRVALSWHNPTASADFAAVHLVRAVGHVPATVDDGTAVPLSSPTASSAVAGGLRNGTAYTFRLFTDDGAGAMTASSPVSATPHVPAAGQLTISLGRHAIGTGLGVSSTVLSGRYTDTGGMPVGGLHLRVMRRNAGTATWRQVSTVTTRSDGSMRMTAQPKRTVLYRFALPASPYDAAVTSAAVKLRYVPTISLSVPSLARTYTTFTVSGAVRPVMGGMPVALRRYYGGAWHTIARTSTGSRGGYRFRITPPDPVDRRLRAVYVAVPAHASAVSATRVTDVTRRDLSSGMTGPDVLALQRRLATLRYDVGAVDGEYGYNTSHAVVAFQKLNGLSRTGVVGSRTFTRLADPVRPHRRHDVSGRSVEVDVTHQVAAFYSDGALYRILDTSTGSEATYWQDGAAHVAHTPRGSFRVERKIDGERISALGSLWRPSYFYEGYAIHGEGAVPPYPASHGCVRITIPAANRYYDWLAIGTRVYVFD